MATSLSTAIIALICLFFPGALIALIYSRFVRKPGLNTIPMDYRIAYVSAERTIQFRPVFSQIILVLVGAGLLLFLLFVGTRSVAIVVTVIIVWFLIAIYLFSRALRIPRIGIDGQEKVVEIGRKSAMRRIPFADLKGVLFSSSKPSWGATRGWNIEMVLKDNTRVGLGSLSGRKRDERRQQMQIWFNELRIPSRVV